MSELGGTRRLAIVAVATFVVLGMPKAAFGVAWPSVSGDLGRDIADLGTILAVFVGGYFTGTISTGRVVSLIGSGTALAAAALVSTAGLLGYAVAGSWGALLVAAIVLGCSGGVLDAVVNAHVALRHGPGVMGWLHAGWGAGSAAGPAMMTGLLALGAGWRTGYWVIASLQAVVLAALVATRPEWDGPTGSPQRGSVAPGPTVYLTLLIFLVYVGLEVAAASWAFTLLTEGRGIATGPAGLAVTGFWVALTAVRVGLGIAGNRTPPAPAAALAVAASVALTALLWWSPAAWVGPVALVGLGAALGPIFPLQTVLTPHRVGAAATTAMIGYQLAAASLGAILIPGGLGPLVARWGVGVVPPVLFGAAVALAAADAAARHFAAKG
jgi:fucose permease